MAMKKTTIVTLLLTAAILCSVCGNIILSCPPGKNTAKATSQPGSSGAVGASVLRTNQADDPANGIYVSPSGNDSGANGSIDKPYKSINTALAAAKPGDTVVLRGGTYREGINVRIRKPNITIKSAKGEWAVIDLTTFNSGRNEDSGVYFDVDSSGGRLQGVEVMGGWYAVCTETRWDWGDPANRAGASNLIIEDCVLHDSRYDVIKIKPNCDNITIRNNEIYNSGQAFAGRPLNGEDNAEGIDNVNGDNMTVQNNYIHDICSTGIYAKGGATDVLIENNFIERAYGAGIMVGFDTSPEYFDTKVNPQYYENIRCTVRNNLIINTGWEGIGLYGSKDARIYNNTMVNVVNSGQYHSAIYFGITFQDWKSHPGRPASVNPNIYNNIIAQPSEIVRPMIEIRYANELGGLSALDSNPVMSNNCYFIAGKNATFTDRRPGSRLENAGFSAWKSHINGENGSIEADPGLNANYIPTNPLCAGMGITSAFSTTPETPSEPALPPSMSNFVIVNDYKNAKFTDINENAWYGLTDQRVVANAYEYGLMQGSGNTFNPTGNMTIAEAVAIAVRVHNIYNGSDGRFTQARPWYQVYINYATEHGIIESGVFDNFERAATRAEMAYIFSRSLPEAEFALLNHITYVPDMTGSTPYRNEILMLYRAGILTGSDDRGTFYPDNNIIRAEAAAIISRVILPETRISKTYG